MEDDSVSLARRSWKDFVTYSVIPTNLLFTGDGGVRCAIRWPTVSVALRRLDGSAIGGASDEVFQGERLFSGKLHDDIDEREGKVVQVLPGWSGSQESTELAL